MPAVKSHYYAIGFITLMTAQMIEYEGILRRGWIPLLAVDDHPDEIARYEPMVLALLLLSIIALTELLLWTRLSDSVRQPLIGILFSMTVMTMVISFCSHIFQGIQWLPLGALLVIRASIKETPTTPF